MTRMLMLLVLGVLGGCASGSGHLGGMGAVGQSASCAGPMTQEQELALNLAEDMVAEGRLYAALAHLQELPQSLPEVRLRQARIYRNIGRPEATPLYESLLRTCLSGDGRHGLGQLAAARGDQQKALFELQEALRLKPTDAKVRNDLGLVYLRAGRIEEAHFEFLTSLELSQGDTLPAVNLLSLLFYEDKYQQAARLVSRFKLDAKAVRTAEERARRLKSKGLSAPLVQEESTDMATQDEPVLAQRNTGQPAVGEEVIP